MKRRVYISSPYTHGDRDENLRASFSAFLRLRNDNIVLPYSPLFMESFDLLFPQHSEFYIDYDLEILEVFDAVLVLDVIGEDGRATPSVGVAREVVRAVQLGIPIFGSVEKLYEWVHREDHVRQDSNPDIENDDDMPRFSGQIKCSVCGSRVPLALIVNVDVCQKCNEKSIDAYNKLHDFLLRNDMSHLVPSASVYIDDYLDRMRLYGDDNM